MKSSPFFLLALSLLPLTAHADEADETTPESKQTSMEKIGRVGSDAIAPFIVVSGLAIATSGQHQSERSFRSLGALATTAAATEVLKKLIHETRPNGQDDKSFPSGHASMAFSTATLLDAYRPGVKGLGYGVATWISLSRVAVKAHYLHDVAAGALLGHFVTRQFTDKYRDNGNNGQIAPNFAPPGAMPLAQNFAVANQDAKWHADLGGSGLTFSKSW